MWPKVTEDQRGLHPCLACNLVDSYSKIPLFQCFWPPWLLVVFLNVVLCLQKYQLSGQYNLKLIVLLLSWFSWQWSVSCCVYVRFEYTSQLTEEMPGHLSVMCLITCSTAQLKCVPAPGQIGAASKAHLILTQIGFKTVPIKCAI